MTTEKNDSGAGVPSDGLLTVLVLPRATPRKTVREAKAKGFLTVLCDDPSKVALIAPRIMTGADDMLLCALEAMQGPHSTAERAKFTESLYRILTANMPGDRTRPAGENA